jgi:hypothetical protein
MSTTTLRGRGEGAFVSTIIKKVVLPVQVTSNTQQFTSCTCSKHIAQTRLWLVAGVCFSIFFLEITALLESFQYNVMKISCCIDGIFVQLFIQDGRLMVRRRGIFNLRCISLLWGKKRNSWLEYSVYSVRHCRSSVDYSEYSEYWVCSAVFSAGNMRQLMLE